MVATARAGVKAVVKASLNSPSIESWESLEAPADVRTPGVAAFALRRSRLCSREPFQGVLFTGQAGSSLSPPQHAIEVVFSKQLWVLMLALI